MRRLYISLFALVVILLLLLIAAYAATPYIVQRGAAQWLAEQGFTDVTLDIERPVWNQLQVRQFRAAKSTDNATLLLETGGILIRYTPIKVWSTQKVDLVELPASHLRIQINEDVGDQKAAEVKGFLDLASFLPAVWFAALPSEQIRIGELKVDVDYPVGQPDWLLKGALLVEADQVYSRVRFKRDEQDLGWGDLELSPDNHFNLRMLQQDTPFMVIDGNFQAGQNVVLHANQLIDLKGLGRWLRRFVPDMTIPDLSGSLSTQGHFTLPLKTALSPDAMLAQLTSEHTFKTQASLQQISPLLKDIRLNLSGEIGLKQRSVRVSLAKESALTVINPSLPNLQLKQAGLHFSEPVTLRVDLPHRESINQQWTPVFEQMPIQGELRLSPISQGLRRTVVSPVQFRVDSADLVQHQYKGSVNVSRLAVSAPKRRIPEVSLKATFKATLNNLKTTFDLRTVELPLRLTGKTTTDLSRSRSKISWTLQSVNLSGLSKKLRAYVPAIPAELSLHEGTLQHNGEATIRNGQARINYWNAVNDANLTWNKATVDNAEWQSSGSYSAQGLLKDKGKLRVARLFSGIDVSEVKTDYRFGRDAYGHGNLNIAFVTASLLGGGIKINGFETALNPLDIATSVRVDQLDIAEILKLEQQKGLSGDGWLSGQFPLRYDANGLSVNAGGLAAQAPGGTIRFEPDATVAAYAAANAGLATALGALENFQYDTLDITLNYAPDGTALLNTRLKGRNPDWNKGHPVNFSINVEENIPDLIRTLQFADELTEKLEKRYRD